MSPQVQSPTRQRRQTAGCAAEELLLCCARTQRSPELDERIGRLVRDGVDWTRLLRLAGEHRVAPLLYWHLADMGPETVPTDVLEELRGHFQANRLRNLLLSGELIRLQNALEARGIPAVPYKGPTLAAGAYGNLALREFSDLDILVRERDVLEAGDLLASLGYRVQHGMNRSQEAAFLSHERQHLFAREDGTTVELHWTVAPRYISFPLDAGHLWERAGRDPLGGGTVPAFPPEDLLLTLCVHGCVHFWERLSWVCDVAELLQTSAGVDLERLLARAGSLKVRRMLLLGLYLAWDLLGADPGREVLRRARADAAVQTLAADVRARIFSGTPVPEGLLEGSAFSSFHFRAIEVTREKLRYCIKRATTPTLSDWEALPLPAALFPLYRLLRPLRLTGRFVRRLARRSPGSRRPPHVPAHPRPTGQRK